jgi:hypothetical protein
MGMAYATDVVHFKGMGQELIDHFDIFFIQIGH